MHILTMSPSPSPVSPDAEASSEDSDLPEKHSTALTLGIEIEFVLVGPPGVLQHLSDGNPSLEDFHSHLRCLLPSTVPLNDLYSTCKRDEYDKWTIETDGSVDLLDHELPAANNLSFLAVELKSRIFDYYSSDWPAEITLVLDAIHTICSPALGSAFRCLANRTCGLHVHVGKGVLGHSFALRTVKNLLQLVTAFERVLDALHTADRISENFYC